MHRQYTDNTQTMHRQYTNNAQTIHRQYTNNAQTMHKQYTDNAQTAPNAAPTQRANSPAPHYSIPYNTAGHNTHTCTHKCNAHTQIMGLGQIMRHPIILQYYRPVLVIATFDWLLHVAYAI